MSDLFQHLRFETHDEIAVVWLSRPPVNALVRETYQELGRFFGNLDRYLGNDVSVVILAAQGPHFCAGNDIRDFGSASDDAVARQAEVRAAFEAIYDCPLPVIGAVQGAVLGSGVAIAAACDFVIAADDARFGLPELSMGKLGGARHLQRLVPQPWARWMFYSADAVPARRLAEFGALIAVVPTADLLTAAREHAARISRHGADTLRLAKRTLNDIEDLDLRRGYALEQRRTREAAAQVSADEASAPRHG